MRCGVGRRCSLDSALLWGRLAAVVLIWPLDWEPPCAMGMALKCRKKRNEKEIVPYFLLCKMPLKIFDMVCNFFSPLMKLSNIFKNLEYISWCKKKKKKKSPWLFQGPVACQELFFQKVYNYVLHLAYSRSENSHGQFCDHSIRSYYIWCLFSSW